MVEEAGLDLDFFQLISTLFSEMKRSFVGPRKIVLLK
jgi:hypothetical protein